MSRINKILLLIILVFACIMLIPGKAQAGLQANRTTSTLTTKTASEFFELIRTMETGTLGKASVGAADGIDCHMAKNTEWGTIALLGACIDFGAGASNIKNTTTFADNESTTGNKSGVYQMVGNKIDYTAHYLVGATRFVDNLVSAVNSGNGKYVDVYQGTAASDYIDGDALNLTNVNTSWGVNYPVLQRSWDTLFDNGKYESNNTWYTGGAAHWRASSRAIVVNGSGL